MGNQISMDEIVRIREFSDHIIVFFNGPLYDGDTIQSICSSVDHPSCRKAVDNG